MSKKTGSAKARNTSARLFAVQALYQSIHSAKRPMSLVEEYLNFNVGMDLDQDGEISEMVTPDETLFKSIMAGVDGRRDELDGFIKQHLPNFEEKDLLLKSILLCGSYELLAHTDLDKALVVSEYLHITKAFYGGTESKLVNAVLDKF
jgi:N utilization substance protein B